MPAPADAPITRPGDLWLLGSHRLLCGDAGNAADVNRLVDGQPIHLCNTDPPYNVAVQPRSANAIAAGNSTYRRSRGRVDGRLAPKDRALANDNVPPEQYLELLARWFDTISRVLVPGRSFYVWGGFSNCDKYPPAMAAAGLHFAQAIIWVKNHPVPGWKDYMSDHEWCFYGWKKGTKHSFFGPRNARDVWHVKKVHSKNRLHLTEKPIELARRAVEYSSVAGENILDLFGGSGSTLMAADAAGRRAFVMEIDAPYCDVIVRRWQTATGKIPVRENLEERNHGPEKSTDARASLCSAR